jgi:MHS family metabolite:H+ symporter-like MFS transporter
MSVDQKRLNQTVISSLIGATIEWYDFFLFGVMAGVVLNKLYFPAADPTVSLMLSYATFAVGFITRPLGGIVFGHLGDKVGRKSVLVATLMIMGVSTFLVGCIPTYQEIGLWAPGLLLLIRVLQGIGLGGEWGGAVLMAYESAPKGKRGFYTSIPQMGLSIGILLASGSLALLSASMSNEDFMSWGWRVCFLASFLLVLFGMFIRTRLSETPEFAAVKESHKEAKLPIVAAEYTIMCCLGLIIDTSTASFNVFSVFSIGYLVSNIGISRGDALSRLWLAQLFNILHTNCWTLVEKFPVPSFIQ